MSDVGCWRLHRAGAARHRRACWPPSVPATFFTSREGITEGLGAAGFAEDSDAGRATVRALGTVPVLVLFLLLSRRLLVQPETRRRPLVLMAWAGASAPSWW